VTRGLVRQAAVLVGGSAAFFHLALRAQRGTVSAGEERVFRTINKLPAAMHAPVWVVMQAGSLSAVPVVAAAAFRKSRPAALALAIDGTAVWALCKIVKRVIKRGRPADCLDSVVVAGNVQRGHGFPSGHAAVATTLAAIGTRLLPGRAARIAWAVPVVVGAGRQYVGAHLPLDVAGGAALGLSAGAVTNLVLDAGLR
jgi:undecaprenyl-diphosphatase